jgi:hypothetical protein
VRRARFEVVIQQRLPRFSAARAAAHRTARADCVDLR